MVSSAFLEGAGTVGYANEKNCRRQSVTTYFKFDDESDADCYAIEHAEAESEHVDCRESLAYTEFSGKSQGSWAQDRRELEASKLSFMRTQRQQQQVDENVRLLLRKLDELPVNSAPEKQPSRSKRTRKRADKIDHVVCYDTSDCDASDTIESSDDVHNSGKRPQRIAAVAQLLKAGVDITGTHVAPDDLLVSEQEESKYSFHEERRGSCIADKSPKRNERRCREAVEKHLKKSHNAVEKRLERRNSADHATLDNTQQFLSSAEPMQLPARDSSNSPKQNAHSLCASASAPLLHQSGPELSLSCSAQPAVQQSHQQWVPGSNWTPLVPESHDSRHDRIHSPNDDFTPQRPSIPQFKLCVPESPERSHIEDELFPAGAVTTPQSARPIESSLCAMDAALHWSPPCVDNNASPALALRCGKGRKRPSVDHTAGLDPFAYWPNEASSSAEPTVDQECAGHGAPGHVVVGAEWRGWEIKTTIDGELFYFHAATGASQWRTPRELFCVLGDWREVVDDRGNAYWANETLVMSCWTDPRCTANIFQAAYDGDMFFAQLYVAGNGNVNVVDSAGCTALHYACASSSEDMAAYLLQNGARADMQDLDRGRPLHWACRYSHSGAVQILLGAGANPDQPDAHGDTPLHLATIANCIASVQALIEARANPTKRSHKQGMRRPSQVAVSETIAAMLQDYERRNTWNSEPKLEIDAGEIVSGDLESTTAKIRRNLTVMQPGRNFPDPDEEGPTSPVMVIAGIAQRTVRPVFQGVRWLANRVLPMDDNRTKCWELGHGAPVLESSRLQRLISSIPRSSLEGVLSRDQSCFDDPPGFEQDELGPSFRDYSDAI